MYKTLMVSEAVEAMNDTSVSLGFVPSLPFWAFHHIPIYQHHIATQNKQILAQAGATQKF